MAVFLPGPRWAHETQDDVVVHKLGDVPDLASIISALRSGQHLEEAFASSVVAATGFHACVIESGERVLAWVDRIRSYPLFFGSEGDVSDHPYSIRGWDPSNVDRLAALELAMAGYTLGDRTLDLSIRQLRAGEALMVEAGTPRTFRYFSYRPDGSRPITNSDIGRVLDQIFDESAHRLRGRRVWVPLSGGWDSRLVLAKFHEHGLPVESFSYGAPGSHEVAIAEQVATRLGVPWTFIPSHGEALRTAEEDARRREYWSYAGLLSSVPSMAEYLGFTHLVDSGVLEPGDVIVNGQAGDFVSGGHIPLDLADSQHANEDLMLRKLLDKHLSLWRHLSTTSNEAAVRAEIQREIQTGFGEIADASDLPWVYESWEYHERQTKFVFHGQRLYEFLGLDWELPLWDPRFADLWIHAALADKLKQSAFVRYLYDYDYNGVFTSVPRAVWRWPWKLGWVVPVGRLTGALRGRAAKDAFYRRMDYHSRYKDQWQWYGPEVYREHVGDMRNPVSLNAKRMLEELGVPWPGDAINQP